MVLSFPPYDQTEIHQRAFAQYGSHDRQRIRTPRSYRTRPVPARRNQSGEFRLSLWKPRRLFEELLERWYEPLFTGVRTACHIHLPSLKKLEIILEDIMDFLLLHGEFIAQLVLDALAGEKEAIRFISGLHTRHPFVLLETIQAAQEEGSIVSGNPMNILIYLVCCGGAPFILSGQLQVHDPQAARPVLELLGSILSDPASAKQRMHWALNGIRQGECT